VREAKSAEKKAHRKWDAQRAAVGFALAFCGASLLSGEAQQRKAQEGECVTLKRLGFTSVKPVLFLLLCPRLEGVTSHDASDVVRRHLRMGLRGIRAYCCPSA